MSPPRLCVIVLNWNAAGETVRCVHVLLDELGPDDRIVVVDNGSHAEDLDALRPLANEAQVTLLENERNLGFAGGTNTGVRHALSCGARWVLWWNNDATPRPGAILTLIETAERLELDAAQPLLVSPEGTDRIDSAGLFGSKGLGASDWLRGEPVTNAPTEPTEILGPCGAAALYRPETLERAGLMDDELFVLCEDLDQALRVRKVGGRAMLVPTAVATHSRGVSALETAGPLRRQRKLWLQRNAIAIGLRDWPLGLLLTRLPVLAYRTMQALWLAGGERRTCWRLWAKALRGRAEGRRQMRRHGVGRFLGLPGQ